MTKFSYIVPTLLKFKGFNEHISNVLDLDCIEDVIIINNSGNKRIELVSEKIKQIKPSFSPFCNGSWNLGVEHSNSDYIILATDDVVFNTQIIKDVSNLIESLPDLGILGANHDVVVEKLPEYKNINIHAAGSQREYCYGLLMFMKRINYTPIPADIRHFYGDDYLYYVMLEKGLQNYVIVSDTFKIQTEVGSMSRSIETKNRIEKDRIFWMKNYYQKFSKYGTRCG